jgi:hypothetical protein
MLDHHHYANTHDQPVNFFLQKRIDFNRLTQPVKKNPQVQFISTG